MKIGKQVAKGTSKGVVGVVESMVSLLSALMAAALILYGGYALYDSLYIQNKAFASSWDLQKYRPEAVDGSGSLASALADQNEDYRGWLTVYNTGIDYPVMQGSDDLYYSSHDVFKKSSLTGSLYLAAANSADFSDNYNLVYGHHMDASALFGNLDLYLKDGYAAEHRNGVLVSREAVFDLDVFAVVETDAYNNVIYKAGERDLVQLVAEVASGNAYYDAAVAESATKVLAMSTCESAETNGRLVVFASMTQRDLGAGADKDAPAATKATATPKARTTAKTPKATTVQTPGSAPVATNAGEPSGSDGVTTVLYGDAPDADAAADDGENAMAAQVEQDAQSQPEQILDDANPLAEGLRPTGASTESAWALLNLLCALISLFMVLPLGSLRAKYRRGKNMSAANEQGCSYDRARFNRRLALGTGLEVVLAIGALIAFFLTADLTAPMVLIDKWTLLMLLFPVASVIVDVRLARYRSKLDGSDGDDNGAAPQRQVAGA